MHEDEPRESWEAQEKRLKEEGEARRRELAERDRTLGGPLIARMLLYGGSGAPVPPKPEKRPESKEGEAKAVSLEKDLPVRAPGEDDPDTVRRRREAAALELSARLFKRRRGPGEEGNSPVRVPRP